MKALFDAAWSILNITITFEGVKFALWHPMAFVFLIGIVIKVLLFRGKEG